MPLKGRYGVDITPLSYLPGGRIERYQGNLNFFFIRESTSIREVSVYTFHNDGYKFDTVINLTITILTMMCYRMVD